MNSVELYDWLADDVPLTADNSRGERLALPRHSILEVRILTLPSGATRSGGKVVNWTPILVDTALLRDQRYGR
jgi:hypothetical protein